MNLLTPPFTRPFNARSHRLFGPLAALALLATGFISPLRAVILNDFDSTNLTTWSAAGGSSASTGVFWGIPGNNQFRVVSGTGGFVQLAKTDFLSTDSSFLAALSANTQLTIEYRSFSADNASASDFNFRLIANTNADSLGYYNSGAQAYIADPSTASSSGTLTWNYGSDTVFMSALNNYIAGSSGTFFEFFLDNSGFPSIGSAVTFSIDNVAAVPEPSTVALLFAVGLGIVLLRFRRREQVDAAQR